jgi:hypothetical protein
MNEALTSKLYVVEFKRLGASFVDYDFIIKLKDEINLG